MKKGIKIRKDLSMDGLLNLVKSDFKKIKDPRTGLVEISLDDFLMSGFALFSLKDPSLLSFDNRKYTDNNLKSVYNLKNIPCDTHMRTVLDEVNPSELFPIYDNIFRKAQRGKILEKFVFMDKYYLASLDGTGYFSSNKIHCASCLEKKTSKKGKILYEHKLFSGTLVHPDLKEVIPFGPEPIIKQDGNNKNDCEQNASKRFFKRLKKSHPHLKLIIVEDGLHSNAPHIKEIKRYGFKYIIGVKNGDHKFLFESIDNFEKEDKVIKHELKIKNTIHKFRFINNVPLNSSNQDLLVNFVEYWEIGPKKTKHFSWVTDLFITKDNVYKIMRGGRSRWKIENETFNTLKNQGYQFEHNFGHGKKNLSVIFALLMMLAFLVDQIQQISCKLFQSVLKKLGSKRSLWEKVRFLFYCFNFDSLSEIYEALYYGFERKEIIISRE